MLAPCSNDISEVVGTQTKDPLTFPGSCDIHCRSGVWPSVGTTSNVVCTLEKSSITEAQQTLRPGMGCFPCSGNVLEVLAHRPLDKCLTGLFQDKV